MHSRELTQEELIAFQDNVEELRRLIQQTSKLLKAGKETRARTLLVNKAVRWVKQERFEPAVAALELAQQAKLSPAQVKKWEEKYLMILKKHAPEAPLLKMMVEVLQKHQEEGQLTFDKIRSALIKMREADIRARAEPFEGPTGSTTKTAAPSVDAADGAWFYRTSKKRVLK
ncbi:MAG: hypothetical protein QW343_02365 [Candidatus Norongarragalinales archaeon]